MRAGLGFPSFTTGAVWTPQTAWNASYPATNLADLVRSTQVARAAASGAASAWCRLAAPSPIQCVTLFGHNLPAAATVRIRFYPDGALDSTRTPVFDSTTLAAWQAGYIATPFSAVLPLFLAAPVTAQLIFLEVNAPAVVAQIGAVDVSGWWDFPIGQDRETGYADRDDPDVLAGGATDTFETWSPRILNAQVDAMLDTQSALTGLDFQKLNDLQRPFLWCQDITDPTSWPRTAWLARNQQLQPLVGALHRRDKVPLRLIEHRR